MLVHERALQRFADANGGTRAAWHAGKHRDHGLRAEDDACGGLERAAAAVRVPVLPGDRAWRCSRERRRRRDVYQENTDYFVMMDFWAPATHRQRRPDQRHHGSRWTRRRLSPARPTRAARPRTSRRRRRARSRWCSAAPARSATRPRTPRRRRERRRSCSTRASPAAPTVLTARSAAGRHPRHRRQLRRRRRTLTPAAAATVRARQDDTISENRTTNNVIADSPWGNRPTVVGRRAPRLRPGGPGHQRQRLRQRRASWRSRCRWRRSSRHEHGALRLVGRRGARPARLRALRRRPDPRRGATTSRST